MTRPEQPAETIAQPRIPELLSGFLQRQITRHAAGFGITDTTGAVVPFDAVPTQPLDPRLAWDGAIAALVSFQGPIVTQTLKPPCDWPGLGMSQDSAAAIAFCAGNFPQMVRNLQPLLRATQLSVLRPQAGVGAVLPLDLTEYDAKRLKSKTLPEKLVALGLLRVARQFESAEDLVHSLDKSIPAEWEDAWANEKAALSWHSGRAEEALQAWQNQKPATAVLFNRGMAALFLDHPAEARTLLSEAVMKISEDDPWHHLGRLYRALANR
jgi:hypothetical protein